MLQEKDIKFLLNGGKHVKYLEVNLLFLEKYRKVKYQDYRNDQEPGIQ